MLVSIRHKVALFASVALLAAAFGATSLASPASATIKLGVYTPGAPANAQAMTDYTAMVGRQPDIVLSYRDFGLPLLYSNEMTNLRATGQTPMVTLEPYDQDISQIASGSYDSYLREQAQVAKSWGAELMIRFAHEMNGTWYPWAGSNSSPSTYVDAWRHVVSVFRAEGVTNVKWVWAPNIQEGSKYPISPYFPGDEWIDVVGLDGYNWGSGSWASGSWDSLQTVFSTSYSIVTQLSSKPVIITETSSSEAGGDKAAWIRSGFMTAIPQSFPRVTAAIWFDKAQEDDWRINSSQASLDAYRAVVACTIYGGTGPCDPGISTPPPSGRKKKKLTVRALRVTNVVQSDVTGAVSYGLSQTATVRIKIVPKGHAGRRIVRVKKSRAGRNKTALERLIGRRKLPAGKYRVVITARNTEGQKSRPHKDRFRVV